MSTFTAHFVKIFLFKYFKFLIFLHVLVKNYIKQGELVNAFAKKCSICFSKIHASIYHCLAKYFLIKNNYTSTFIN